MVYFTSDSHYGHKNIIKSLTNWTDKNSCRNFNSIEDMNNALVAGINSVVRANDILYHLGDWNFGGIKNQQEFRHRVICQNVHLILGNHDFNHGSIDPSTIDHGFSSISPYKEIKVEGQEIILCHYALRVWNRQGNGAWHLYGHSHGNLKRLSNFSLDAGVEGMGYFNPVPWNMDDLRAVFSIDSIIAEDGHEGRNNPHTYRRLEIKDDMSVL